MNTRFCTVVTVATLVSLSTGCSGMKNFLFGRGARCGLCTKLTSALPTPCFGNAMQAPPAAPACQTPSYAPAPAYAPAQTYAPAPACQCNEYAAAPYDQGYSSGTCGSCGDDYAPSYGMDSYGPSHYGPAVVDPYQSGGVISGQPFQGQQFQGEQIIGSQPLPQGALPAYPSGPVTSGPVTTDNFQSRKFDSDGNKILWEEPLPQGTRAL